MADKRKVTELTGLEVQKVGLVEEGANKEQFFLLKREEGKMANENVVEAPDLMERVKKVFTDFWGEKKPEIEATAAAKATEVVTAAAKIAEIPESIKTELAALKKAQDETVAKLKATEEQLAATEAARVRQVYLEKAAKYPNLPVGRDALAEQLEAVGKAGEKSIEFMEALLKAANTAFSDAVLFKEFGISAVPKGDLLEKAEADAKAANKPLRDTVLEMPAEDQAKYLRKRHAEIRSE